MAEPPITERHKHHFHRKSPIKEPVRAATTAPITIATALNNGDSLDGVTLATGDRVLVKDQSSGAENGIYIVGASPARAYDFSTDDPDVMGAIIRVLAGTTNGGTTWANTNATSPTIGTTAITFAAMAGGSGAPTTADYLVGTAQGGLSAEIVVGTTPGGELGGTWASPTVDATHSGSTHDAATNTHIADTTDAHDASAISIADSGGFFTGTDVEAALQELGAGGGGGTTITTKDEGSTLSTAVTTLDFVGAGVTASGAGATTTVTIPGGGGGSTIAYGSLKPGSPTMDFTGSDLAGATAHSSGGSFATTDCFEQALDGSHISLGLHNQMGALHWTASNVDQELICGDIFADGTVQNTGAGMYGIALLNSSGTGVGVLLYGDNNAYLADIVTWNYSTFFGQISGLGHDSGGEPRFFRSLRLTRVGNTWDGYISLSGNAWDFHMSATGSKTITVDRKCIGMFYNTASTYKGRITADYLHTV